MARRIYFGWPVVINDLDLTEIDSLTVTDNLTVGGKGVLDSAVSDSVGFYGVGPVSQRRSASQAAVTTLTGTASTTNLAAKLNALIVYSMRVRSDLIAIGAIKGGA
jgi:hypothetical protein